MHRSASGATLAWLAVAFAMGIRGAPLAPPLPMSWLALALCVVAVAGTRPRGVLVLVCVLLGLARGTLDMASPHQPVAGADDRQPELLRGVVTGPVEDRRAGARFVLSISAPVNARVLVTVRDNPRSPVLPGDRVEVQARLRSPRGYRVAGAVDARQVAHARGADLVASVGVGAIRVVESAWSPWRGPARVQRWMSGEIRARGGDATSRAVVRAMVTGDRGGIDHALAERFRRAGASHLLAVSGLHLAVVTLLLFALVRRLWASVPSLVHRVRASLVAAVIAWPTAVAYTAATGARISTLRALLVITIVLGGVALARRARVIDALAVAAVILLLVSPATLYDPSFQLSFAATAVLCLAAGGARGVGPVTARDRVVHYALGLLRASAWATAATAPFTALAFGSVAPGGVLANVFVVPLAELVVLPVALLGVAVSGLSETVGGGLIDVSVAATGLAMWFIDVIGSRAPVFEVPSPRWWELLLCACCLAPAVGWARGSLARRPALVAMSVAVAGLAASWVTTAVVAPRFRTGLRVTYVDVGQGDGAVVEFPGGAVWLVDAGGRPFVVGDRARDGARLARLAEAPGEMAVVRYLRHRRVRRIERVVITHPHPDHYVGLAAVARHYPIGEVWLPRAHEERPDPVPFGLLMWQLERSGTHIRSPALGITEHHGVAVSVLHPRDDGVSASSDPALGFNDNSLVLRLDFAGKRLLFLGDVETEAEHILVTEGDRRELRAHVVKVPHHGSATSSTQALVDAVRAQWAVVSCGVANRFGFPAPAVVARWRAAGTEVVRTDVRGAVTVTVSRGGDLRLRTVDPLPAP